MNTTQSEIRNEMHDLLLKELELNGINLKKNDWLSSTNIIQEITYTLIPETHERKINSYGVIFVESMNDLENEKLIKMLPSQIELARKLANGNEWFVLYEKNKFIGVVEFCPSLSTEIQLIKSFPISGGMIIQRNSMGVTKIFQGDSLTIHENRKWFTKPNIKAAAWKVSQCVANIDKATLNQILEFAFCLASPAQIGAILVWFLKPLSAEIINKSLEYQDLSDLKLSFHNESHAKMICHLLSQTDGATFLDPKGNLIKTGIHLKYTKKSSRLISEFKGTRHTSSLRYSYDIEDAIIVTISEDGPVTVFLGGANIANLQIFSAHKMARKLGDELPEQRDKITSCSFEKVCKNCNKLSMIEQVLLEGYNLERKVICPVCRDELHSAVCFSLEARPFKINE